MPHLPAIRSGAGKNMRPFKCGHGEWFRLPHRVINYDGYAYSDPFSVTIQRPMKNADEKCMPLQSQRLNYAIAFLSSYCQLMAAFSDHLCTTGDVLFEI